MKNMELGRMGRNVGRWIFFYSSRSPLKTNCRSLAYYSRPLLSQKTLAKSEEPRVGELQTSFAEKTKENVKTAGYTGIVLAGIGVTGALIYFVGSELFSGDSPHALFESTSEKCVSHPKVQDLLGMPIKSFGVETRRGRRRHVASFNYVDPEGRNGTKIEYYLQGLRRRATVRVDARDDGSGSLKVRYIIVTADDMLRNAVVVEDNT